MKKHLANVAEIDIKEIHSDRTREEIIADIMYAIGRATDRELRLIRASAYGATGLL